jgi:hypothetical protein
MAGMSPLMHAAVAVVYPTEAAAREAIGPDAATATYLGIWERPAADDPPLHVFGDDPGIPDQLMRMGWWRPAETRPEEQP